MSLSIAQFDEFFHALWSCNPFPWQSRLAEQIVTEGWPDCIDLPTASGKTAAIDVAVFALACQSPAPTNERTVGRRILFTVNRRIIVDEAFERARTIAKRLLEPNAPILTKVANALHEISGDFASPPLDVAQLRGGIYRDRVWARSITQPIVVCTTADQLGSRLLFRGYGVSASSAPIHAALCGCDSLVLLDEAHVTRAFCQTMRLISRYQEQHSTAPAMQFVQMTATPAAGVKRTFELDEADLAHPILKQRLEATKLAELVLLTKKKPIAGEIVTRAFGALSDDRKAIGIIVNRVQTAREIESQIREEITKRAKKDGAFTAEVHLVIGRMRPIDRDRLQETLRALVGPDRPEQLDRPVFVVATQCLEVGADYDFDALVTECASIDALRQRFGRLNRKARQIDIAAAIVANEESLRGDDPIYGDAIKHTWQWLSSVKDENDQVDFGIAAFRPLWKKVEELRDVHLNDDSAQPLLSPSQNAAVLLPAHLDALCQTNPQPIPSPDVSYFIHGPQRDNAEVNVCWRADFDEDHSLWAEIVGLLPPTSRECMTVPLLAVTSWMRGKLSLNDADVPVDLDEDEPRSAGDRYVLRWRGVEDAAPTNNPRDLRPGDTIVIAAHAQDSLVLGHIPEGPDGVRQLDIAEQSFEDAHRQRVIRIHPAIHPELCQELKEYAAEEEAVLSKPRIRELLGPLSAEFKSGPDEIVYPGGHAAARRGLLLRFNALLPDTDPLRPFFDDDDGEGSTIESTRRVDLKSHTEHVVQRVSHAVEQLSLKGYAPLFKQSALLHDLGKADTRFQAVLAGMTPYEAMERPVHLAKSGRRGLTAGERVRRRLLAELPPGFRHEMLSLQLAASGHFPIEAEIDGELLQHLIASHHGHARPFAPVVIDEADDETQSIEVNGVTVTSEERRNWIPAHRLDSGVAERFWELTRAHGWWGLAWLESILRLADQQASAAEEKEGNDERT